MSSSQEKKCMYSNERELDLPQWFHNIYKYQIILLYNRNNCYTRQLDITF